MTKNTNISTNDVKFIFFGTDDFSVETLKKLKGANFLPNLIITAPDKPSGRGLKMQKTAVKIWAEENKIEIIQPKHLDADFLVQLDKKTKSERAKNKTKLDQYWDIFVVSSFGKIIPDIILDLPKNGTLNVHPSLLPLYRGASPVESAMLNDDKKTGVTIMLMDEEMDHGAILNQEVVEFTEWPTKTEVEKKLAQIGGEMLVKTIPLWLDKKIIDQDQDHSLATYTKKITKEDGEISLDSKYPKTARRNFLKIQALNPWPGAYFFIENKGRKIRVKITEARFNDATDELEILKVIPEGRKETDYKNFQQSIGAN